VRLWSDDKCSPYSATRVADWIRGALPSNMAGLVAVGARLLVCTFHSNVPDKGKSTVEQ
jgi:hypothetical protein